MGELNMQYTREPGGCCGLYVANAFGPRYRENVYAELQRLMRSREENVRERNPRWLVDKRNGEQVANVLSQCTLTDDQMRSVGDDNLSWAEVLQRDGWRLVTRFYNSNSGNNVNVLHHSVTRESRRVADVPFRWRGRRG
jgi:hypothetical protein